MALQQLQAELNFFIFSDASLILNFHSTVKFFCCVLENTGKQTVLIWKVCSGSSSPWDYTMITATISLGSTWPAIGASTKWDHPEK